MKGRQYIIVVLHHYTQVLCGIVEIHLHTTRRHLISQPAFAKMQSNNFSVARGKEIMESMTTQELKNLQLIHRCYELSIRSKDLQRKLLWQQYRYLHVQLQELKMNLYQIAKHIGVKIIMTITMLFICLGFVSCTIFSIIIS